LLSNKTIFLIGVAAGLFALAIGAVIIIAPLNNLTKLGVLTQAYIFGKVSLPVFGKIEFPAHLNTYAEQKKIGAIYIWGAFLPVLLIVIGHIVWLKI
jgi:hypothetical protein